jgi:uroporphyrinogen III methyltransferase/synthase
VLIIGTSAQADERLSWFMKKSLFGKTIVLTRDRKGNNDFAMELLKRGANPILFDTIEIKSLTQNSQFLKTLSRICEYRWIIFTSANGVEVFFDSLSAFGKDVRIFSSAKIAAVGPQTAAKLLEFGIKADFVPDSFTTENLGRQLIDRDSLKGKKVLLLRSALADNQLAQILSLAGAFVEQADLYTVTAAQSDPDFLIEIIEANRLDWLTFASSSSVRFFFEKIPAGLVSKAGVKIASIGPVTSQEIKNFGIKIDIEAAGHTIGGLIEAIENTYH